MPSIGNITPKNRRCLENMAVAGPSTVLDLNALDPDAPDHRQTIKQLEQTGYVIASFKLNYHTPVAYSLTDKAKRLLAGKAMSRPPQEVKAAAQKRRYANPPVGGAAGPVVHGSMTTRRLDEPCADMLAPAIRPGAEHSLDIPSRVNDQLHYRDGRVVQIHSNQ